MAIDGPKPEHGPVVSGPLPWLARAQVKLAALAVLATIVVTTADVVMRYAFNRPIRGSYDFVEAMLVIVVFNGLSAGFASRSHIVIDLIDHFSTARLRRALMRLADLISLAALLVLAAAMVRPALQAYDYGDVKLELGLPIFVLWTIAGIGMAGTILSAAGVLLTRPGSGDGGARQ